jgi:hypothetical protein
MKLIKRQPSPAQSRASRANSRHSTGPRSERGKATVGRNFHKPRVFSQVVAKTMRALGEHPGEFEQMHRALAAALEPRDAWEAAWVQDIAILRWRLERVQRAELGNLAARRRKLWSERQREGLPQMGSAELALGNLVAMVGFAGIADSPLKFRRVFELLHLLREAVVESEYEEMCSTYLHLLYGNSPGFRGAVLKANFERVAQIHAANQGEVPEVTRQSLLDDLDKEISDYEQLEALYAGEHLEDDPLQQDAELLLPGAQLDEVIRYETHLEDQIERKLRQFYARRRESVLTAADSAPKTIDAPETSGPAETLELARQEGRS